MNIGSLKEVKTNENRVGITPDGAKRLKDLGHKVYIEHGAGTNAGYSDESYTFKGAELMKKEDILRNSDIIVKVKEPVPEEYRLLELMKGKILFTYLHLAAAGKELTQALLANNITAIAYETVRDEKNRLPLLSPMSEIAGVLAIQYGAQYLQKRYKGKGTTLGRITGTPRPQVVVVGGGTAGAKAALTAAGIGSSVTILELSEKRIEELREMSGDFPDIKILKSTPEQIADSVRTADLLVGAVLVPGTRAPEVVTKDMIAGMEKGSVIIDIAIDQGGCVFGSTPTTHENPTYERDGIIYCCVTNMPGEVPCQSTKALTSATIKYLEKISEKGLSGLIKEDANFASGINTMHGRLTNEAVARAHSLDYTPLEEVLKETSAE